jgi:hypothetical protein
MAKALIFFLFFIIFLILKVIFLGGKKIVEVGAEAFDSINGTHFSDSFKEIPLVEAILRLFIIGAYENEEITPKGPSFTDKIKSRYNNIIDFFSSKKQYFMINGFMNFRDNCCMDSKIYSHISQFEYLINLKTKYYLKLTTGSASYKKTQTDENYDDDNYGEDIVKEDYSYKYTSVGLSTMILQAEGGSKSSIDIDYVVPFSQEGTKKVGNFFNIVWNNDLVITDNIVIGTGFVIGGEEAWKDNWWTVRLGIFF